MYTRFFWWTANLYAHDWLARFTSFAFNQLKANAWDHTTIVTHGYWLPFPSDSTGFRG